MFLTAVLWLFKNVVQHMGFIQPSGPIRTLGITVRKGDWTGARPLLQHGVRIRCLLPYSALLHRISFLSNVSDEQGHELYFI